MPMTAVSSLRCRAAELFIQILNLSGQSSESNLLRQNLEILRKWTMESKYF